MQASSIGEVPAFRRQGISLARGTRTANNHCELLRGELDIRPDQTGPWNAFAASLIANADRLDVELEQHGRRRRMGAANAFERLDQVFGPREARLSALATMRAAAEQLYAVLTLTQRQQADRLLPLCCLADLATSAVDGHVRPVSFF